VGVVAVALLALATPPGPPDVVSRHAVGLLIYERGAWREPGSVSLAGEPRVVLLVHGLDEPGDVWEDLTPALAGAGWRPVRFDYPNDQAVERSGALLAAALGELGDAGVARLSIVAHSMGGLVTLDALTRPDAAPGAPAVDRLVTLGTPWGGSPWTGLRWAGELREQIQRLSEGGADGVGELRRFLDDGRGEAAADLAPDSAFLGALLARPRPEGVAITCIRGRLVRPPPGAPADLFAMADTLGDGVVPIASAALPGVDDVVEVGANHRAMVRRLPFTGTGPAWEAGVPAAAPPPAIPVILERLARGRPPTRDP